MRKTLLTQGQGLQDNLAGRCIHGEAGFEWTGLGNIAARAGLITPQLPVQTSGKFIN